MKINSFYKLLNIAFEAFVFNFVYTCKSISKEPSERTFRKFSMR